MIDFVQFKNLAPKTQSLPIDSLPAHVLKVYEGQLLGGITSRDDNEWTEKSQSNGFLNYAKGSTCFIVNRPLKWMGLYDINRNTDFSTFPFEEVDILYVDEFKKECLVATKLNDTIWTDGSAEAVVDNDLEDIQRLMPYYLDYVYVVGEGMWELSNNKVYFTPEKDI